MPSVHSMWQIEWRTNSVSSCTDVDMATWTVAHRSLMLSAGSVSGQPHSNWWWSPDISLLCLAVNSTHTAVGRFRSPVRRPGIRCRTSSEIQRVVLTVLNSSPRQSSLVSTNVTSALEVFLNDMRYINPRFTYLLTYLLTREQTSTNHTESA